MESSAPACAGPTPRKSIPSSRASNMLTRSPTRQEFHVFYGSMSSVRLEARPSLRPPAHRQPRPQSVPWFSSKFSRLSQGFLPSRDRFLRALPRLLHSLPFCPMVLAFRRGAIAALVPRDYPTGTPSSRADRVCQSC
jgi:hypothetical protein